MSRLPCLVGLIALVLGALTPAFAEPQGALVSPGNGAVRALVVGIDQYHNVNTLRGAVADAKDLDGSLRKMGAKDVTVLINDEADRHAVLQNLDALLARTQKGDLIIITLAGHGSKEHEHVKGSSPDGTDEVFLLVGFDPKTGPGGSEKLLNHEFNHYIHSFEERGAQVLFVADTCYGGGLTREVAVGSPEVSYRQVTYRLAQDDFKPVSTNADAFLTELDFDHTTFLAAVDSETEAPEVIIDGAYRGALSYATARALEGAANPTGDGKLTMREFFGYARKVVYQLSDERQNIVTLESPRRNLDTDVVFQWSREGSGQPSSSTGTPDGAAWPKLSKEPIRLATTTTRKDALAGVNPLLTPFNVVAPDADPDVLWDPAAKEAIAGGDKIALDVSSADLPGIIDRTAAVRDIKTFVAKSPQSIHVSPDASLHRSGSTIEVEVSDAAQRSLILVDITGSGTLQLLYPMPHDPVALTKAGFRMPFKVREPFGADEVVAITSERPMPDLAAALHGLDNRRSAGELADVIERFGPSDARVGIVGLFTKP